MTKQFEYFIDPEDSQDEPSFYLGWYAAECAMAEYLGANPGGKEKVLAWKRQQELDTKEQERLLRPYHRLQDKIIKECREQGHPPLCRKCLSRYYKGANLIEAKDSRRRRK